MRKAAILRSAVSFLADPNLAQRLERDCSGISGSILEGIDVDGARRGQHQPTSFA
jgi:hypothetical protein